MENFILRAIILAGIILAAFAVLLRKKPKHITSLKDKHVFITGGSSGIGFALAKLCLSQGAYVTLISKTHAKLVNAYDVLTKTMGYPSDHIRFEAVDVGDAAAVSSAVKGSLNWRAIDILICNAGLACQGHLDEVEIKQLEYMARSNFLGCVFPLHAALSHIKSRSFHTPCSVVIMGSSASLAFIPEANIYTATKHALKGLADYLRVELMPYNIPVTFACPPFVETPMLDQGKSPYRRMFLLTMFGVMFVGEGEQNPCRELDEGKLANCILIVWLRPSMHLLTWHDAHYHYNKWKGHFSSRWEMSVHHYELIDVGEAPHT